MPEVFEHGCHPYKRFPGRQFAKTMHILVNLVQFDSIVRSSFLKQIPLKFPLIKKKPEIFLNIFIPDLIILVEQVMVVFAVYIMSEG